MRQEFPSVYYRSGRWLGRQREDKQRVRAGLQVERHDYARGTTDELWVGRILRDLERATPSRQEEHAKRIDTVRLPEGVRAVFRGNAGEAILEIMRRTGSHVQMTTDGKSDPAPAKSGNQASGGPGHVIRGFQRLTLWGSPAQNAAAIDILPDLAQASTEDDLNASKDLKDYNLRSDRLGSVVDSESEEPAADEMDVLMGKWENDELAQEEALPEMHTNSTEASAAPEGPRIARAVWTRNPLHAERAVASRFQSLSAAVDVATLPSTPAKPITSILAFAAHIEDITTSMPRTLIRKTVGRGQHQPGTPQTHTAVHQTAAELTDLFTEPMYHPYVSAEAVDTALTYLAKHREFPTIRRFVAALENNTHYAFDGARLTPSNLDILLAAAAKAGDVLNFRYLIRLMVKGGSKSTWRTWVRLYELVCRLKLPGAASEDLMGRMQERGFLKMPQAMREIVAQGVEGDLEAFLRVGKAAKLEDFVALYDQRYSRLDRGGDEARPPAAGGLKSTVERPRLWLSTSTANRMVDILLHHGRTSDAIAVLGLLEAAGERPDVVTLNTVLAAASRARDAEVAIAALKMFAVLMTPTSSTVTTKGAVKPNQRTYEILFHIVWGNRWFNMLRVVWRYACVEGCVSFAMQQKVKESLMVYVPAPGSAQAREGRAGAEQLAEELTLALGGFGKKKAERKAKKKGKEEKVLSRDEVFFGWAGKFAVGVWDGKGKEDAEDTDAHLLTPHECEVLALSAQARQIGGESNTDAPSTSLDPHDSLSRPSHVAARGEQGPADEDTQVLLHKTRRRRLLALLEADMSGTSMRLQPVLPFATLLERAWQLDVGWKDRGLGQKPEHLKVSTKGEGQEREDCRAAAFAKVFGKMLGHGLRVLMVRR